MLLPANTAPPLLTTRLFLAPESPTTKSVALVHDDPTPVTMTRLLLVSDKLPPILPEELANCPPAVTVMCSPRPPLPTTTSPKLLVQVDPGPVTTASLLLEK